METEEETINNKLDQEETIGTKWCPASSSGLQGPGLSLTT